MEPARTQGPIWRLGTIGFAYKDWDGPFYPKGIDARRRLPIYAEQFNTIELDTTFHALPRVEVVRRWAASVPDTFRFSLKAPKTVTHEGGLNLPITRDLMREFLDVARELGDKLGVVLLQFPHWFRNEGQQRTTLELFLRALPADLRYAVELRDDSWWTRDVAEMFRLLNTVGGLRVAWASADQPVPQAVGVAPTDDAQVEVCRPRPIYPVGDFLYIRWVGNHGQFQTDGYEVVDPTPRLKWWVDRLESALPANPGIREVWGFFGNTYAGHAPATLRRFVGLMGLPAVPPEATPAGRQTTLF